MVWQKAETGMWSSWWLYPLAASALTSMWAVITSFHCPPDMAHLWSMWVLWSTRKHHRHRSSGLLYRREYWLSLMNRFWFLWLFGVLLSDWYGEPHQASALSPPINALIRIMTIWLCCSITPHKCWHLSFLNILQHNWYTNADDHIVSCWGAHKGIISSQEEVKREPVWTS